MMELLFIPARFLEQTLAPLRQRYQLLEAAEDPIDFLRRCDAAHRIRALASIGNAPITREMLELLPGLEHICNYGAGYDKVDLQAARERNLLVTNTPGTNASCVADLAIALLLACVRRLLEADRGLRAGEWARLGNGFMFTPHLAGRKVGIYGLGEIGSRIATRAQAFEMEVGYHNRRPRADQPYRYFGSLPELADWADDLIISVNASDATVGSVDAGVLQVLGPQAHVVNVARGSIVDEHALVAALREQRIAGAALDVFRDEPQVQADLLACPSILLSPHMAAKTPGALRRTDEVFWDNLDRFFQGEPPRHAVLVPEGS